MSEIFNWKLNTTTDYLNFFIVAIGSILLLVLYYKRIERGRTEIGAKKRVAKKLKKYALPNAEIWNNVTLTIHNESITYDHLLIDEKGILAIKTFHWGTAVFGEHRSETWKLKDNRKSEVLSNPILDMEAQEGALISLLSAKELFHVPIVNIAILADTFEQPLIFLGKNPPAITFKDMKPYCIARKAQPTKIAALPTLIQALTEVKTSSI